MPASKKETSDRKLKAYYRLITGLENLKTAADMRHYLYEGEGRDDYELVSATANGEKAILFVAHHMKNIKEGA